MLRWIPKTQVLEPDWTLVCSDLAFRRFCLLAFGEDPLDRLPIKALLRASNPPESPLTYSPPGGQEEAPEAREMASRGQGASPESGGKPAGRAPNALGSLVMPDTGLDTSKPS